MGTGVNATIDQSGLNSNHEIVELGLQDPNSTEKSPARYVAYADDSLD